MQASSQNLFLTLIFFTIFTECLARAPHQIFKQRGKKKLTAIQKLVDICNCIYTRTISDGLRVQNVKIICETASGSLIHLWDLCRPTIMTCFKGARFIVIPLFFSFFFFQICKGALKWSLSICIQDGHSNWYKAPQQYSFPHLIMFFIHN